MVCEHLAALERHLLERGERETFRGQSWSENCREWVYFSCVLDLANLRARFNLAPCVVDHVHNGTHDGREAGFVCAQCDDAVMGLPPGAGAPTAA